MASAAAPAGSSNDGGGGLAMPAEPASSSPRAVQLQAELHDAAEKGRCQDVYRLLDVEGAEPHSWLNGFTPLGRAANKGHSGVVALLLEKGVDVNSPGSNGWTALHVAASRGRDVVMRQLVHAGADVCALTTSSQSASELCTTGTGRGFLESARANGSAEPLPRFMVGEQIMCHSAKYSGLFPAHVVALHRNVAEVKFTGYGKKYNEHIHLNDITKISLSTMSALHRLQQAPPPPVEPSPEVVISIEQPHPPPIRLVVTAPRQPATRDGSPSSVGSGHAPDAAAAGAATAGSSGKRKRRPAQHADPDYQYFPAGPRKQRRHEDKDAASTTALINTPATASKTNVGGAPASSISAPPVAGPTQQKRAPPASSPDARRRGRPPSSSAGAHPPTTAAATYATAAAAATASSSKLPRAWRSFKSDFEAFLVQQHTNWAIERAGPSEAALKETAKLRQDLADAHATITQQTLLLRDLRHQHGELKEERDQLNLDLAARDRRLENLTKALRDLAG